MPCSLNNPPNIAGHRPLIALFIIVAVQVIGIACGDRNHSTQIIEANTIADNGRPPSPKSTVNADDSEEYSVSSLRANLREVDVVVYAEVTSIKPQSTALGYQPYILTALVKEVYKGSIRKGASVEYRAVYENEPTKSQVIGDRILWLRNLTNSEIAKYEQGEFMPSDIRHNIREKLNSLSQERSTRK